MKVMLLTFFCWFRLEKGHSQVLELLLYMSCDVDVNSKVLNHAV